MAIAKIDLGGVAAYPLDTGNTDQAFAKNQLLLARAMASDLCAGAFNAKQFSGDIVRSSAVKTNFQNATLV